MAELEAFTAKKEALKGMNGNRELKEVFEKMHFDAKKLPKTLRISKIEPQIDKRYNSVKEGSVILSILQKGASTGFALHTGDLADLIYSLTRVRDEMLEETYRLTGELENTFEYKGGREI